jgi:tripartite-type tricarboxylate transporter receptor subunit TctC
LQKKIVGGALRRGRHHAPSKEYGQHGSLIIELPVGRAGVSEGRGSKGAIGRRISQKLIQHLVRACGRLRSASNIVEGHAMRFQRRQFLHLAAGAAALPAVSRVASAQLYPSRPITMILPFAAGGTTDVIGRVVAERMKGSLGQPIIVENVSGADSSIGVGRAARARPDGYTIELGDIGGHVLNGAFYSLQYDVLNDFAPISPLVTLPFVLFARKTIPAKDLRELITWLKANPDEASAGITGSVFCLLAAFFQEETATHFTLVPYRGGAPAIQDLIAGQIDLYFGTLVYIPQVRAGSIKAYAVTSDTRMALAPNIPTFAEMGLPALSFSNWGGLFAPKGTPKDIIGKLDAAAVEALADPGLRSRLADLGFEAFPSEQQTPQALGALVKADAEKYWPLIKELGIKAE